MSRATRGTIALLAITILAFSGAQPGHAGTMTGDLYQAGCYPANASWYDPVTGRYDCTGYGSLSGTLNGVVLFRSKGTNDAVTGDTSGTIDVRIAAVRSYGVANRVGQIYLKGTTSIVGSTGATKTVLTITSGTGDFTGATGSMTIKGISYLSGLPSALTYSGTWSIP